MKLTNNEIGIEVEFKSFSIKFMKWLFGLHDANKLYQEFVKKNGEKIFKSLIESVTIGQNNEKDYSKFVKNLHHYIFNLTKIYGTIEIEDSTSAPVTAATPVVPIPAAEASPIDNIMDDIYGPDFILKSDNFLNVYRSRSNNRIVEELRDEEELLMNDLYFQDSYGELNVSKDIVNENIKDISMDNLLNEE